jgi:hypothetical protein
MLQPLQGGDALPALLSAGCDGRLLLLMRRPCGRLQAL